METLPPQGMVLSTHILLVYCQMKNNVSIAQIELVMESESAISADFFSLYIYIFLLLGIISLRIHSWIQASSG